ncbi:2,3-diaminopropionate biosynthesis protein SbnA [Azospirillum agricola]|uniref:PLP-dependent cysteine synthase family protein n=1 Tax=Azospirillum agricola TaxID=1720247 RepID=UPI001AE7293A|nr:cysteine synthase family protein [Azospirillum agricola]MBP2232715.1 2,3-diaminopropionate biosynthesis protein SbnA [Azospirillum agricola]
MIHENLLATVGDTPVVRVATLSQPPGRNVFAKLEFFNPGRSVKDRIALNIIERAEERGELARDPLIIESSSGNTGIGLSIACRVKGYRNIVVVDQNCPVEKLKILQALGATILMVRSEHDKGADLTQSRIRLIEELRRRIDGVFVPNQYENPDAPDAHYRGTGQEIVDWIETHGITLDAVLVSVGTGGTITGVSRRIKAHDPAIRVIGVEPVGSTLFGGTKGPYLQQGPGNYFIPKNLDRTHVDGAVKVGDRDAFSMCRRMAQKEGLLLGGSAGAVLHAARHQLEGPNNNVLCVLPDSGEKYLDTIYSDMWLADNGIELDSDLVNSVHVVNMDGGVDYESLANLVGS